MKKYKITIITLGIALLLCSCGKDVTKISSSEIPEHITKQLEENLNIDADIIIPKKNQSKVEVLEIESKVLNTKEIINNLYPNAVALYEDDDIYEDGMSTINMSDGNYYYDNKNERIYNRFFTEQKELLFPTTSNLKELKVEDSLEKAKSYLSHIGLNNTELSEYYVLSRSFLESQYNETKKENGWAEDVAAGREVLKEDWENEKGAYIFNFEVIENGLPISRLGYHTKDNEYIGGSSIQVCCSQNGVAFVSVDKNYSVKALSGSKKLVGMERIIEGIEHKFSNLIIQEPITITKIRLIYQPQKIKATLYLVPVWEVGYLEECDGIIEKGAIYFDAETGKEIVVY